MNRDEALEMIDRIPFVTTINAPGSKARLDLYKKAVANKRDPLQWIKVIKSAYLKDEDAPGKIQSTLEREFADRAKRQFHSLLAESLEIKEEEVEAFIAARLKESA